MIKTPICPYCQKPLQKTPARKTRCPHCSEFIFVRTISTETVLFTQDQLQKYEEEQQELRLATWHADEIARILHFCNISEASYQQEKNDFENKSGSLSREAELRFAWEIVKYQAAVKTQAGNRVEWFSMAVFAYRHSWEYRSLLEMAAELELLNLKKLEFNTHVRVSTSGNKACPACQTLENQIFAIDDALQQKILPHKDCSYVLDGGKPGFCRCLYLVEEISTEEQPLVIDLQMAITAPKPPFYKRPAFLILIALTIISLCCLGILISYGST